METGDLIGDWRFYWRLEILLEIEDFNGDNEDHDENEDTIEMNENNDAPITENRMLGIRETLGREYVSMEQAD